MTRFLVITAGQRTGTTALGSALGRTGEFRYFGEIFHDAPNREHAFLGWMQSGNVQWADTISAGGAERIATDYFEYLEAMAKEKFPLVDVKLNSWMTFHPGWTYPDQRPFLLDFLLRQRAVFLFLRRRDLTGQILSEFIARHTGKWHDLEAHEAEGFSITVPVDLVKERALNIIAAEKMLAREFDRYSDALPIWYEDLYQDGNVGSDVVRFIEDRFGLSLGVVRPPIAKNAGEKSAVVANFDEIVACVKDLEEQTFRTFF